MSHRGTYILARQESPEFCLSIFSRCKQYQDGNDGSVKTFRELSINVSTNVVNETENRLLKSGKDISLSSPFIEAILPFRRSYLILPSKYIFIKIGADLQKSAPIYNIRYMKPITCSTARACFLRHDVRLPLQG